MAHVISKALEFCYGHRVWTQVLNAEFANDLKCACRHLHGHEGKVEVYLESFSGALTSGMVTDFRHLEWLKQFLNTYIDHQFIMDANDPLLPFFGSIETSPIHVGAHFVGKRVITTSENNAVTEMFEGLTIVNFTPTSENLAKWLCDLVTYKMKSLGVKCVQVDWWETPKSKSTYKA